MRAIIVAAALAATLGFDFLWVEMEHSPVRVPTPYPLSPDRLVGTLKQMVEGLPSFDRVSVGFPGMVREGKVLTAPHFVSPLGPGGKPTPELLRAWTGFDLQSVLATTFGKPTRVANDADMQGAAVIQGVGLELVVTLGTGVGTGLFWHGQLAPHLELAHHSFRRDQTYNEQLGAAARKRVGSKKWNHRVELINRSPRWAARYSCQVSPSLTWWPCVKLSPYVLIRQGRAAKLTIRLSPALPKLRTVRELSTPSCSTPSCRR